MCPLRPVARRAAGERLHIYGSGQRAEGRLTCGSAVYSLQQRPYNFGFIRRHISKGRPKMEKSKIIVKEDIVDFYDRLCEAYKNYPEGSQREKLKIQIEELKENYAELR